MYGNVCMRQRQGERERKIFALTNCTPTLAALRPSERIESTKYSNFHGNLASVWVHPGIRDLSEGPLGATGRCSSTPFVERQS